MPFVDAETTHAYIRNENYVWRITPRDSAYSGICLTINQATGVLTLRGQPSPEYPLSMGDSMTRIWYEETLEELRRSRERIPGPNPRLVEIGNLIDNRVNEGERFSVPESARAQLRLGAPVLLVTETNQGRDIYAGAVDQATVSLNPPVFRVEDRYFTPTLRHPADITKLNRSIPLLGTLPKSLSPSAVYVTDQGIIDQIAKLYEALRDNSVKIN